MSFTTSLNQDDEQDQVDNSAQSSAEMRHELEQYIDEALHKLDSEGNPMITIPSDFDTVTDLMTRDDLTSTDIHSWSRYLFDQKYNDNLKAEYKDGRYDHLDNDISLDSKSKEIEEKRKIEQGLNEIERLDIKLKQLIKQERELKQIENAQLPIITESELEYEANNTFITTLPPSPSTERVNDRDTADNNKSESNLPQVRTSTASSALTERSSATVPVLRHRKFPMQYKAKLTKEDEERIERIMADDDDDDNNNDDSFNDSDRASPSVKSKNSSNKNNSNRNSTRSRMSSTSSPSLHYASNGYDLINSAQYRDRLREIDESLRRLAESDTKDDQAVLATLAGPTTASSYQSSGGGGGTGINNKDNEGEGEFPLTVLEGLRSKYFKAVGRTSSNQVS